MYSTLSPAPQKVLLVPPSACDLPADAFPFPKRIPHLLDTDYSDPCKSGVLQMTTTDELQRCSMGASFFIRETNHSTASGE